MPGVTFGWGPLESSLIAYAERLSGSLILMDKSGSRQKIEGTKNIVLPAFSPDGKRLAYFTDLGHGKYTLVVASIQRSIS
jgi:Tol biopolymer transport system component